MRTALFIGPSAPRPLVDQCFTGEVLPPVGRGDLDALVARGGVDAVGIVDGAFFQRLAVTPKEVLRAIDAGVRVFGSSSMGALRAVECRPFGMVGTGRIFRMFESGEVDADDEVAIVYDPETLRPLAEPLVNVRAALSWASSHGLFAPEVAHVGLAVAKELYFPDRTYPRILQEAKRVLSDVEHARLSSFLTGGGVPDQKRLDAVELMQQMEELG